MRLHTTQNPDIALRLAVAADYSNQMANDCQEILGKLTASSKAKPLTLTLVQEDNILGAVTLDQRDTFTQDLLKQLSNYFKGKAKLSERLHKKYMTRPGNTGEAVAVGQPSANDTEEIQG